MNNFQINGTISIHQPLFLPWFPYVARLVCSEIFVPLDNVQYRKDYYQNRTLVKKGKNRQVEWLTIPVKYKMGYTINEIKLEKTNTLRKTRERLYHNYCKAHNFNLYWPMVEKVLNGTNGTIVDLNMKFLLLYFEILNVNPPKIVYASTLYSGNDKSERIVEICHKMDSYVFLNGWGKSKDIHDQKYIRDNGIKFVNLDKQKVVNRVNGEFLEEGLSLLDLLFKYDLAEILENIKIVKEVYIDEISRQ